MQSDERCAYVVDDEAAVRRSVGLLLRAAGYDAESFESGEAFLRAACDGLRPGCVLLDLRMPGLDGLDVQRQITARRLPHPVVIITAHGDVPLAVAAMKAGACDFVEKPFAGETILRAADAAMRSGDAALAQASESAEAAARLATLSPREADVLRGVVSGRQNKVIARMLGISPRTVEIHRGNVMTKLGVRSVPEAMRLALAGGFTATTSD
jgi:two-component system response regulator FixJ